MIEKNNNYKIVDKEIFIEKLISKKIKKDFSDIKDLIKSSISKKIKFQELITSNINGKNQSLIYIKAKILNDKNVNEISKLIYNSFSMNPFIFELEKPTFSYFVVNSSFLKNNKLDLLISKTTKKKNFLLIKVEKKEFNEELNYFNLLSDSILNMFNDIIYKFVYFYLLKIDKKFKRYIDYLTLLKYSEISYIQKKIINLKRKVNKSFNLKEKSELNTEIFQLQKKCLEYQKDFDNEYDNTNIDIN